MGWLSFLDVHDLRGLLLEASFKENIIWHGMLEKMEYCLVGWMHLNFSKGGRNTLIKSSLSNWPIDFIFLCSYFLSVLVLQIHWRSYNGKQCFADWCARGFTPNSQRVVWGIVT